MLKTILIIPTVLAVGSVGGYLLCMNQVVKKYGDSLPNKELSLSVFKGKVHVSVRK